MSATFPEVTGPAGSVVTPQPVVVSDQLGNITSPGGNAYTFCSAVTLVAGSGGSAASPTPGSTSNAVSGIAARSTYVVNVGGTVNSGAALQMESLAPDGVWDPIGTALTARGPASQSFQVAANATIRFRNTGTASVTNCTITMG